MHGCVIVFGMGFTGTSIARLLAATGMEVHGTSRTPESAESLVSELGGWLSGVHVVDGAGAGPEKPGGPETSAIAIPDSLKVVLSRATHIISTAQTLRPAGGRGAATSDVSRPHDDPVLPILDQARTEGLLKHIRWAGYLSTTGVYGDRSGAWADESDAPRPTSARAKRRMAAEAAWLRSGMPVHVFRLPGIYGPGRGPLAKVREGKARIVVKARQYFSRVHTSDVAGAVLASILRPTSDPTRPWCGDSAIFNVADDQPGPQGPVTREACRLLGVPAPKRVLFEEASKGMSVMARSFFQESRRVSSRRARDLLGWRPAFPGYIQGLSASLREEEELERGMDASVALGKSAKGLVTFSPTAAAAARHHFRLHGLLLGSGDDVASEPGLRPWMLPRLAELPACSGPLADSARDARRGFGSACFGCEAEVALVGPRPWSDQDWWGEEDASIKHDAAEVVEARAELPDASVGGAMLATVAVISDALACAGRAIGLPLPVPVRGPCNTTLWLPGAAISATVAELSSEDAPAPAGLGRRRPATAACGALVDATCAAAPDLRSSKPIVLVVDNGSLRAGAALALRRLCCAMWQRFGVQAIPASARFSDRVAPSELGGLAADTVASALERVWRLCPGRRVVILPLFFGPSRTVTGFLPAAVAKAAAAAIALPPRTSPGRVRIAPWLCLAGLAEAEEAVVAGVATAETSVATVAAVSADAARGSAGQAGLVSSAAAASLVARVGDEGAFVTSVEGEAAVVSAGPLPRMQSSGVAALATALADRVMEALAADGSTVASPIRVLLCEHGSPSRDVHAVRPVLARALHRTLQARGVVLSPAASSGGIELLPVTGCAMERRPGDAFAFSEPMLESALPAAVAAAAAFTPSSCGPPVSVVVSLMFLLPGKHAGAGGDVAEIATTALGVDPPLGPGDTHRAALRDRGVLVTDVIGEHPAVLDLLWRRLQWSMTA